MARVLTSAAINVLRDAHYVLNTVTGLYERTTLIEKASTNICIQAEDLGVTWSAVGTPSRSAAAHTASGVTLDLIGDNDGGALEGYSQTISPGFTGDAAKAVSFFIKQFTGGISTIIRLRDTSAGVDRLLGAVAWSGGVPSVTTSAGTYRGYEALADGTYRVLFSTASVTAANSNTLTIYPASTLALAVAETGEVYVGGFQAEDSTYPTSYKKTTTSAAARSADLLSFPFTTVPQNMTVYVKFIERGQILQTDSRVLQIGAGNNSVPRLVIREASGFYRVDHETAVAQVLSAQAAAPAMGNTVELRAVLGSDGSVICGQSINGAAETIAATSAGLTLSSAWSDTLLWLGQLNGASGGANAFLSVKVAKGTKTLTEMRALADMAHSVLVLNAGDAGAIHVPCARAEKAEPEDIGGRTRAFAGNLRVSTRDQKRAWAATTSWIEPTEVVAIQSLIADNAILPCAGLLLDHETINCSVKCTNVVMKEGASVSALTLSVIEV